MQVSLTSPIGIVKDTCMKGTTKMSNIEKFLDLPLKQKVGAVCLAVAAIYMVLFLVISGFTKEEEQTPVAPSNTPIPVAPVDPTPTPTETAKPNDRPYVGATQIPEVGKNALSIKDARAALDIAEKGVGEFINWPIGEKIESRQKRIDKYFTASSTTRLLEPTLSGTSLSSIDEKNGKSIVASFGKTTSVLATGGDTKRFRANIGIELRYQLVEPTTGESFSAIELENLMYTVDLTKEKTGWKIIDVVRDK